MANTDKRKLGPSEVDQDTTAQEIVEETNDIKEYQPSQTTIEEKKEKLDRGEELYTGFGFDSDRANGEAPLADSLKETKLADHNTTKSATNTPDVIETYTTESSAAPRVEEKSLQKSTTHTPRQAYKTTTTSEKREVPEQTKLIIEPDNGDINYKKRQADPAQRRIVKTHHKTPPQRQYIDHEAYGQNGYQNAERTIYTEPNYESQGVHYSTDPRTIVDPYYNNAYIKSHGTVDYLPIKHHYKSKRKQNKKSLPWRKIALGVAVAAGVRLLFLGEEDDGPFWS